MDERWKTVYGEIRKGPVFTTFHLEVMVGRVTVFRQYKERNNLFEDNPRNYHYLLDLMVYQINCQLERRSG